MKLAKLFEKKKINISTGGRFFIDWRNLRGNGYSQVVQADQGLWVHPVGRRRDVFVHISAVEKAGLSTLGEGARVSYELFAGRGGKSSAEKLRVG